MSFRKLQSILIYISILSLTIKSYIIIPLKSTDEIYFQKLSKTSLSINNKEIINEIFLKNLNNVLYTDLIIGEPNQKSTAFISQKDYGFMYYEEYSTKELKELGSSNYNSYSKSNSETISQTHSYKYEHSFWSYLSHEDFLYLYKFNDNEIFNIEQFDNKKQTKTENKIEFIYTIRNSSKIPNESDFITIKQKFEKEQDELRKLNFKKFSYFNIGLQYGNKDAFNVFKSFIDELYSKGEINNKQWNLYYTNNKNYLNNNDYNTFLIIGSSPHIYFPNYFNEKELYSTYSEKSLFSNNPILSFYSIYTKINNENISLAKFDKSGELNFNFGLIKASWQVKTILEEKYFHNLIQKGKCFESRIDKTSYSYYVYYYCDKNKITNEELTSFPGIYFQNTEFSYTFELNNNDLFQTFGDVIIFKMIFDTSNSWILGKPFLTKYLLSFNDDNKKIYFYNSKYEGENNNTNKNENENNKYLTLITILAICGIIIFGIVGFFIGKWFYNKKKKISHELDELEDENMADEEKKDIEKKEEKLIP